MLDAVFPGYVQGTAEHLPVVGTGNKKRWEDRQNDPYLLLYLSMTQFLSISVFPVPTWRYLVVFSRFDKIPYGVGIMPVRFTERMVLPILSKSFSSTPTHSPSQAKEKES